MKFWWCAAIIAVALVSSSGVAAAQNEPTQLSISTPADTPIAFDTDTLQVTAGADVVVTYTNDSSIPHNWHLFAGGDATAPTIVKTPFGAGPGDVETVEFTAPDPGSYYYVCDFHPNMSGQLVVSQPD
jgi:plastocyanin